MTVKSLAKFKIGSPEDIEKAMRFAVNNFSNSSDQMPLVKVKRLSDTLKRREYLCLDCMRLSPDNLSIIPVIREKAGKHIREVVACDGITGIEFFVQTNSKL